MKSTQNVAEVARKGTIKILQTLAEAGTRYGVPGTLIMFQVVEGVSRVRQGISEQLIEIGFTRSEQ